MTLQRHKIRGIILVCVAALAAAAVAGVYVHRMQKKALVAEAFNRLGLFQGLRKATIEDYMRSKESDVRAMSRNRNVVDSFFQLTEAWHELGPEPAKQLRRLYISGNPFVKGEKRLLRSASDGSRYTQVHKEFHDWARRFLEHFRYRDLYFIDAKGNILYSVNKSDDYATNLLTGPYDESALGYVYQQAIRQGGNRVTISDFEIYGPSGDVPAAFAGSAVVNKDGKVAGVVAVQLSPVSINDMLRTTAGMGETGQTYIVGNDLRMRSQSRFISESTLLKTVVDTESVRKGLGGFSGKRIGPDYRKIRVLSVYSGLDNRGEPWALIAEMDEAEVLGRVNLVPILIAALVAALLAAAVAHLAHRVYTGT